MMQHSACLRQGITQSFWKQKLGENDEYSQKDCSRDSDGNVPSMYFNPDNAKVNVNAYNVDNVNPTNGLRSEVFAKNPVTPEFFVIACFANILSSRLSFLKFQ
jgi:hypothetical protein